MHMANSFRFSGCQEALLARECFFMTITTICFLWAAVLDREISGIWMYAVLYYLALREG
jgi:hypothetical protein